MIHKKEPANDNGHIAAWLKRMFYGASNDNVKGQTNH